LYPRKRPEAVYWWPAHRLFHIQNQMAVLTAMTVVFNGCDSSTWSAVDGMARVRSPQEVAVLLQRR